MQKYYAFFLLLFSGTTFAQTMKYTADLAACKKDRVSVQLTCNHKGADTAFFSFPMTIPGTYAVLDYGRYISGLKAFDSAGKALKVKKKGNNTFTIVPGKDVAKIQYLVDDSWEEKNKKTKIFEPAGTGFEANKFFYINSGGLFGFFGTEWNVPFEITFQKPTNLKGFTTLKQTNEEAGQQQFLAKSYHELIDNPILFTSEKEQTLAIQDTKVSVASYYAVTDSSGYFVKLKIDSAMHAIDQYVGGKLPVNNYAFLNYVQDYRDIGELLMKGDLGPGDYIKIFRRLGGQGFGALEHGNSSSYFLPDFGKNSYTAMLYETAIHEFMHIYTPLSLHSQYIGDFNYIKPIMSKHLWLYEGVTEYSSVMISMQGKLATIEETLNKNLKTKIASSYSYPDSIPFTKMSANVFDKPYIDYYGQVYERGAIMAMLLDIEIMRLTNGSKTLKSVIFSLSNKYGSNRSFSEETFIDEFVAEVHPDLKRFFSLYVEGTTPLAIEEGFNVIGINYKKELKGIVPKDILSEEDNKVKANRNIVVNNTITVQKADKANYAGLMAGDKVNLDELASAYKNEDGTYISEGTMITLNVERKGKSVPLTFPAKFKEGVTKNVIEVNPNMTAEQEKLFYLWSTGKPTNR